MSTITVDKGEILQKPGEKNKKVYIVQSGLLRSYTVDEKGREHIFMFAPENWILCDYTPKGEPSQLFIDALEDTIVEVRNNDSNLLDKANNQKIWNRLFTFQQRVINLLSLSSLERYYDFIERYPRLIQRVPQKMIASYLGVTPEALSSLKNKAAKKNK